MQAKPDFGYHRWLVQRFMSPITVGRDYEVLLVAADAPSEGAAIAEVALHDPARRHYVLRASKLLLSSDWLGSRYRLLYPDTASIAAVLDDARVSLVILQHVGRRNEGRPDIAQLEQTVAERPATWLRLTSSESRHAVQLFRRIGPMLSGEPNIRIDMKNRLGRMLEAGKSRGSTR